MKRREALLVALGMPVAQFVAKEAQVTTSNSAITLKTIGSFQYDLNNVASFIVKFKDKTLTFTPEDIFKALEGKE